MGQSANHFVITGHGIEGTVDTAGLVGQPVAALQVDGSEVADPTVQVTPLGVQITGLVDAVEDLSSTYVRVMVPEVNLSEDQATVAGIALVAVARTSIGGPGLVDGVLQTYDVRPVAATASVVNT